jgi:DNA mismatch repair protein MutS2
MQGSMSKEHTLAFHTLDWMEFLSHALRCAKSEPGKEALAQLQDPRYFAKNPAEARFLQIQAEEAGGLLQQRWIWDALMDLAAPHECLSSLEKGRVLTLEELVLLRGWLRAGRSWRGFLNEDQEFQRNFPCFQAAVSALPDPREALKPMESVLDESGEISDSASPLLRTLRGEIYSIEREIEKALERVLKRGSEEGTLQENYWDVRDGRYVLPVKIEKQGDLEGVRRDVSVSRQTVFIEPIEVERLNRELQQKKGDLQAEIYRILVQVSVRVLPFSKEISKTVKILVEWDEVQAKARVGEKYRGRKIDVLEDREFNLEQTAHPLLWWSLGDEEIIRNDLKLQSPALSLLITGPNTGGKTVFLKTLGFAALCARAGFPFPGIQNPKVPFFDQIFADLGDQQSIEKHLSSFSGHVLTLKEILEKATNQSLVLLDELNSATDPEEGAALARALLEELMDREVITISTSHDPTLKLLALSEPRILNAGMAFEEKSAEPTYRLMLGAPGRSRALETAERLGLSSRVLSRARSYLRPDRLKVEDLLEQLEAQVEEARRASQEADRARKEAQEQEMRWKELASQKGKKILLDAQIELREMLQKTQEEFRSQLDELKKSPTLQTFHRSVGSAKEVFESSAKKLSNTLKEKLPDISFEKESNQIEDVVFRAGDQIYVSRWKKDAKIISVKGDQAKVVMGSMTMNLPLSDLQLQQGSKKVNFHVSVEKSVDQVNASVHLRGKRYEEAMEELEIYLDRAYRSGLKRVRVIHGHGTGALKGGAHELLRSLPYVVDYQIAEQHEGGAGVTVAHFS